MKQHKIKNLCLAIKETLSNGLLQELAKTSTLIDHVERFDYQLHGMPATEQDEINQRLRSTFSDLGTPKLYLADLTLKPVRARRLGRVNPVRQLHNQLLEDLSVSLSLLTQIQQRVKPEDFRLDQLVEGRNRTLRDLKFFRLTLQQASSRVTGADEHAENFPTLFGESVKLLRLKLDTYFAFPQNYISEFNDVAYLAANPDVKSAIQQGLFPAALAHFVEHGLTEVEKNERNISPEDPIRMMVNAIVPLTTNSISDESSSGETPAAPTVLVSDEQIERAVDALSQRQADRLQSMRDSKLVDEEWYAARYLQCKDSVAHFFLYGTEIGSNPNFFFDYKWYANAYIVEPADALEAVFHYIEQGADNYFWPGPAFEPDWYQDTYDLRETGSELLVHYLTKGRAQRLSPNSVMDVKYYRSANPDIVERRVDAVEHFYTRGWLEGRDPCAHFQCRFYKEVHLKESPEINPVIHYLHVGRKEKLAINSKQHANLTDTPQRLLDVSANLKFYSNKGPDFEEPLDLPVAKKNEARAVAYFLPQFYAFPENDEWWGKGFTEWRNVSRGAPRFEGHYQPRIPRDLGFYDLTNEDTLVAQSRLALENGIEAFCFYYYWFNGKRLMDKPLDLFAESKRIDQDFCIMWANENWTRTWDGFDSEVLIEQDYRSEDEDAFIADTGRYFSNPRYMTVAGRPLFVLYRPGLVQSAKSTIARWRQKWKETTGLEPLILQVQGFGECDPTEYGLDGAVEFPPHKVAADLENIHAQLNIIDPDYKGNVVSYNDVVKKSLNEKAPDYPLIKTVSPHWDNDARREGRGFTLHGSSPENYHHWLRGAIRHSIKYPFNGESLVFINAWNEWAESAYLEPDVHFGHAYLNATKRALQGISNVNHREKILLVGHDAHPHGAQMLLINIADTFKNQFGFDVVICLKKGGPLLKRYEKLGKVYVLEGLDSAEISGVLVEENCTSAITNTSVTGDLVPLLKQLDIKIVSLVHELPTLIKEYDLSGNVQAIADGSDHVVFASDFVEKGFLSVAGDIVNESHIKPQGIYKSITIDSEAGATVRNELGIPRDHKIVLNVGYGDMRKGVDLFLATAKEMVESTENVHFVWVGGLTDDLDRWALSDINARLSDRIHFVGFTDHVSDYFNASDCFYLTSREDPYPSVVLEAMAVGCPAVIFKGATGFERVVHEHGFIVDKNNNRQIVEAIHKCVESDTDEQKSARIEFIQAHYQFDEYCFALLNLLRPDIKKVSVVVPNYNYENHIEARLLTVFAQRYPIFETIVLEDCSPDNSLEVIESTIRKTGRKVKLVVNDSNSGNTFKQWDKGLALTRGDYLWIAEADDTASSRFIGDMTDQFNEYTNLCFCDSGQIDAEDNNLGDSYGFYYRTIDERLFQKSFSMPGDLFVKRAMSVKNAILNVSSVVWRTEALRSSFSKVQREVLDYKLVGDWRLYLDVLLQDDAQVAYISTSLNTHRRHAESVTHALDAQKHLEEISAIHSFLKQNGLVNRAIQEQMDAYMAELRKQFGVEGTNGVSVAA